MKKICPNNKKEIKKIVEKKLRYTIKYAYKNSPFYRKLFKIQKLRPEDIKNVSDL